MTGTANFANRIHEMIKEEARRLHYRPEDVMYMHVEIDVNQLIRSERRAKKQ